MTVVISGKQLRPTGDVKSWPLAGTQRSQFANQTKSLDMIGMDIVASYAAIYGSQPWIFALVNKLTRNIARMPLRTYRLDEADGSSTVLGKRDHPLPVLLSRPYPRGSKFKLIEATIGSMCVYGHALWWKFRPRPGMTPVELWPIDWRYITIKVGENDPIEHYEYRGPAGRKIFLPDDVVHFEWWSPAGPRGTSPLEPLRQTLQLEDAGRRYATSSFANGIRPSGALVSPKPVIGEQREELKAEIEAIHGNPDNAFRMMLLDGGLDWKTFAHTAQEAQTIEHRKLNAIEACAVYDMPPPMVQILDKATFSNIDEQHQMLYMDSIGPYLGNVEETIAAQLLWGEPTLATAVDAEQNELEEVYTQFDMSELLRPSMDKRADAYVKMRNAGAYTVNDVRAAEGKPKINHPAADAVLIPLNMDVIMNGDEAITPRGDPATAALMTLADHLQNRSSESADALRKSLETLEERGGFDTAKMMRDVADALLVPA